MAALTGKTLMEMGYTNVHNAGASPHGKMLEAQPKIKIPTDINPRLNQNLKGTNLIRSSFFGASLSENILNLCPTIGMI